MKNNREGARQGDDEAIAMARAAMALHPHGGDKPTRTDAPLRSAYSPSFIEDRKLASGMQARRGKPVELKDLFLETLKEAYYAEEKILRALPRYATGVDAIDLSAALEKQQRETATQVERLEQVFGLFNTAALAAPSPAIDGIIEEGDEVLRSYRNSSQVDAALVAWVQAIQHYQIARYGTLVAWSQTLGVEGATRLLKATLAEEMAADERLSTLGETLTGKADKNVA